MVAATRPSKRWRRVSRLLQQTKSIVLLLAVVAAWEAAVPLLAIPRYLLPSPSSILARIATSPDLLAQHALVTTRETLEGFALGVVVGVVLAVLIVHSRLLEDSLYPILIFLQLTPKTAIAPLLIVWMGFGDPPKIAIAFLISFFPMVIDTATGLRAVEPDLLDMLHGLRATPWQVLVKARFPSALPFIFSGMRISITLAVTGAVVAEFVGASEGLGHLIVISSANVQTDLTFAAILTLAVIGVVLFWLIGVVERLVAPWQAGGGHGAFTA
jgi:NitT/TauT family transport system permease protein